VNSLLIRGLEPTKPKGWFELRVEGGPPFLVDGEIVLRHSLKTGDELSEGLYNSIRNEADIAWLKSRAMAILARRMISERDLRRKLSDERRPQAAREEVISLLKNYNLIDDAKYAESFVRTQVAHGPESKLYLKKKLRQKGIDDETAQNAIEAQFENFDEVAAVKKIASKKYKTVKHLPPQKARARVINFLRGRGFSWDIIKQAIADLFSGRAEDE
jgi:regulatory protein